MSLNIQFLGSEDYSTEKYVEYLKSYSPAFWCGMPNCLNPRKLVNLGFKCVGPRHLQCIEDECAATAIVSEDVAFEPLSNENLNGGPLAKRFLMHLQDSCHNFSCKWNKPNFKDTKWLKHQDEFNFELPINIHNFVVKTKKILILRW